MSAAISGATRRWTSNGRRAVKGKPSSFRPGPATWPGPGIFNLSPALDHLKPGALARGGRGSIGWRAALLAEKALESLLCFLDCLLLHPLLFGAGGISWLRLA